MINQSKRSNHYSGRRLLRRCVNQGLSTAFLICQSKGRTPDPGNSSSACLCLLTTNGILVSLPDGLEKLPSLNDVQVLPSWRLQVKGLASVLLE